MDWPTEWDIEGELNDAWAVDERQPQGLHFTPKVAPSLMAESLGSRTQKPYMIG